MGKRLALLLLALSCVLGMPGDCGHLEMQEKVNVTRRSLQRVDAINLATRNSLWNAIRIKVYYGTLQIDSDMETKLKSAVEGATHWYSQLLKVKTVSSSWKLEDTTCLDYVFTGSIVTDQIDADYVFYVEADSADNGLAGAAVYCQQDSATNQPILGHYYFNGLSHSQASDEQILATTIHEMTHALGFSPSLYDEFLRGDGSTYPIANLLTTENVRGQAVLKLVLPTVLEKARAGFQCSSLNGLELESQGSTGTVGAHWEKRLMYNDYMVADSDIYDVVYSDVTVALFEDSGWYEVNYKYAQSINWGKNAGCGFINQKCVANGNPISDDFCTEQNPTVEMCDFMHVRKGYCSLGSYQSALPSAYQYFADPKMGGSDQFLDYCPVVKPYTNGDCRDPDTVLLSTDYGEDAGPDSRCITGTYSKSGSIGSHSGCHSVSCSGTTATITIGDTKVTCPATGGDVKVTGYSGVVHCPPSDVLCRDVPCINNCNGMGYCQESLCVCDDGSSSCQNALSSLGSAEILGVGVMLVAWLS